VRYCDSENEFNVSYFPTSDSVFTTFGISINKQFDSTAIQFIKNGIKHFRYCVNLYVIYENKQTEENHKNPRHILAFGDSAPYNIYYNNEIEKFEESSYSMFMFDEINLDLDSNIDLESIISNEEYLQNIFE
jgi:hypothetical protein